MKKDNEKVNESRSKETLDKRFLQGDLKLQIVSTKEEEDWDDGHVTPKQATEATSRQSEGVADMLATKKISPPMATN